MEIKLNGFEKMKKHKRIKVETEHEEAAKTETSPIDKLPDDCLIEIFRHLTTISDKIRIERGNQYLIVMQYSFSTISLF